MPGLGRKAFVAGEVLTAADLQGYAVDQSIMVFANSSARSSAIGTAVTEGMFSFLTGTDVLEYYSGTQWVPFSAGAKGGGTNQVFYENDTTVTANYTISTSKNAVTAGPVTINNGVTVTVPSGSVWVVV